MRTIAGSFNQIKKQNEHWGDYVCLIEAVRGRNFTRRRIYDNFIKLVNLDEYDAKDTNQLVAYLHQASKVPEECTFLSEIAPERDKTDLNDLRVILAHLSTI